MPRLPPVTRTLCIGSRQLSGRRDIERVHESDHGGHLVRRKTSPAIGKNHVSDLVSPTSVAAISQNDIDDHDRARDRAAARPGAGHPDLGMPVDDRFDFFGMNLQTANVDDTAAPADKVVSVAAQLDHVAGVDESFRVGEAAAWRPT